MRTHPFVLVALGMLGGVLLGGTPADKQAPPTDAEFVHLAGLPDDIPEEARDRKNTRPATKESTDYGGLLFSSQCVMCHDKDGRGTGDLVERLSLEIPDLTDPSLHEKWTDGQLFYVLSHGHGRMPDQERFKEEIRWDLVNYIRTLARK
jgi:mono/diheme cytochrome c family protein